MVDPRWIQELKDRGLDQIPHTGGTYLTHLTAVHAILQAWQMPEDVCAAGFFHSIYGTQRFTEGAVPASERGVICGLIGKAAERIAYANCVMVRSDFDKRQDLSGPTTLKDRLTGGEVTLTGPEWESLLAVHLADWLEQLPRCHDPAYRKDTYLKIARHVGGRAQEDLHLVYSVHPRLVRGAHEGHDRRRQLPETLRELHRG